MGPVGPVGPLETEFSLYNATSVNRINKTKLIFHALKQQILFIIFYLLLQTRKISD